MNLLITINAATLITVLLSAIKIMRFIDKIEFRVEILWKEHEERNKARQIIPVE